MTGPNLTVVHDGDTEPATPPVSAVQILRDLIRLRPDGEVRPQQEAMVVAVEQAMADRTHLLVQAGTGTGKSLGYAIPAITSGKRVVISTATKQLSEQLFRDDLPALAKLMPAVGGPEFTFTLVKGRANYACLRKIDELVNLDADAPGDSVEVITEALFEIASQAPAPERVAKRPTMVDLGELNALLKWADKTRSGDRTDAPPSSDKMWNQISTDAAGCPGSGACPFAEDCFAEKARDRAKKMDVVVANHALIAQDLIGAGATLGEYDCLITDEVHELESYLSSAFGVELSGGKIRDVVAQASRHLPKSDCDPTKESMKRVVGDSDALTDMLSTLDGGVMKVIPEHVAALLQVIYVSLTSIANDFDGFAQKAGGGPVAAAARSTAGNVREAARIVLTVLSADEHTVRWLDAARDRFPAVMKTSPLWVGQQFQDLLGDRTLVATSATITVSGSFAPTARALGMGLSTSRITEEGNTEQVPARMFTSVDVGTPFDFPKQGMIYIPDGSFPAPVGQAREAHTQAVLTEITTLVKAAGGRTLALFTTTAGARRAADHLRREVSTPVLCQGDAPAPQLVEQFVTDEAATLCATMGMWHGLNASGPTCSLVVMDKLPFAPMFDPLMSARREAADRAGRDGYTEIFVNGAAIRLAQGAGRLIRTATDKGVIAILDNRVFTKGYGRTMLAALPPMGVFRDQDVVVGALTRLTGGTTPGASRPASTPRAGQPKKISPVRSAGPRKAAPSKAHTRNLGKGKKRIA
ncbi:MAG: ATP-dependent DNA helicase [Propionicimonas sp.]